MEIKEPTSTTYSTYLTTLSSLFKEAVSDVASTGVGSVIREWVIRPISILFGGADEALSEQIEEYSLANLKDSTLTENEVCDSLMSNFFVERKGQQYPKGIIAILSTSETTVITAGTTVTVGDIACTVDTTYWAQPGVDDEDSTDSVTYVEPIEVFGGYLFNIQVTATVLPTSVIPVGADVTGFEGLSSITSATLISPLSGGSTIETDASMIARARETICSTFGGSSAIHKILTGSPYTVLSSRSFGVGDEEMVRDRYNTLLVSIGGCIDTYVKTSNAVQSLNMSVTAEYDSSSSTETSDVYTASLSALPAGFYTIHNVSEDGYSVEYGSSDSSLPVECARFSSKQRATLTVTRSKQTTPPSEIEVSFIVDYMPGIADLQSYIDTDNVHPVGLDVLIKACLPAYVSMWAGVADGDADTIKDIVSGYISDLSVGDSTLLVSDIQKKLSATKDGVIATPVRLVLNQMNFNGEYSSTTTNTGKIAPDEDTVYGLTKNVYCLFTDNDRITIGD